MTNVIPGTISGLRSAKICQGRSDTQPGFVRISSKRGPRPPGLPRAVRDRQDRRSCDAKKEGFKDCEERAVQDRQDRRSCDEIKGGRPGSGPSWTARGGPDSLGPRESPFFVAGPAVPGGPGAPAGPATREIEARDCRGPPGPGPRTAAPWTTVARPGLPPPGPPETGPPGTATRPPRDRRPDHPPGTARAAAPAAPHGPRVPSSSRRSHGRPPGGPRAVPRNRTILPPAPTPRHYSSWPLGGSVRQHLLRLLTK